MNRSVEASPNTPLPSPLFWLEKGYPATLIFDPYGDKSVTDADRTQKRSASPAPTADGTSEIFAADIEEVIPLARAKAPQQASAPEGTQEIRAQDILEEEDAELEVELAPPPPEPPPPPEYEPRVIIASQTPSSAFPVHAPGLAPVALAPPPPPAQEEHLVPAHVVAPPPPMPSYRAIGPADSSGAGRRITALATGEWQRRRRVGHWLVGGALVVASAVVLAASAVHAFAAESTDISVFSRPAARVAEASHVAKTGAPLTTATQATQSPIQTVSIDSLPAARRSRR